MITYVTAVDGNINNAYYHCLVSAARPLTVNRSLFNAQISEAKINKEEPKISEQSVLSKIKTFIGSNKSIENVPQYWSRYK